MCFKILKVVTVQYVIVVTSESHAVHDSLMDMPLSGHNFLGV